MLSKHVVRVALLVSLVCAWGLRPVAAVPTLSLIPSSPVVQPGQSFSLDVTIADVTDLFAFGFDLVFDPGVLAATGITEGSFLPNGGATFFLPGTIDNPGGTITATGNSLIGAIPGVDGGGTLATITLQALTPGISPLTLANVLLLDSHLDEIPATIVGSSLTVSAPVPEPGTWVLLGTGLVGLLGYGWRRQRSMA